MPWLSRTFLLWLQFSYAVWQAVREAKVFRIPAALFYHSFMWLARRPGYGKPFSQATFSLVVKGHEKWTYPVNQQLLEAGAINIGGGHYLQREHGSSYLLDFGSMGDSYIVKRKNPQFLCSKVDMIFPRFYIADAYNWSEGFEKFMVPGTTLETVHDCKALFMSSREHFLNQNFTRLLSLLPLMLQARGFEALSVYTSIGILALDQLSYPANVLWSSLQDVMVDITRSWISKIHDLKTRKFIAMFMTGVSERLAICDEVYRNFYFVRKNQEVLVFGNSCADFLHDDMRVMEEPHEVNGFVELEKQDYDSLSAVNGDLQQKFEIQVGNPHLEHFVNGACIKSFFIGTAFYNFIDNEHLHWGVCEEEQRPRMQIALKWIENNGRMPVTCSSGGGLKAVKFNKFVQAVPLGYSPVRARVQRGTWVQ